MRRFVDGIGYIDRGDDDPEGTRTKVISTCSIMRAQIKVWIKGVGQV